MKTYLYLLLCVCLLVSCDKNSEGPDEPNPGPGTDPGTEEPTPDPEPESPEGTLSLGGLFWDTENTFDYCSFAEALAEAKKQGKRVPTREEWKALAEEGSAWDEDLLGRWYGPDAELKSGSKQSIFLPALGFYSHKSDKPVEVGKTGIYWSLPEYSGKGYTATFSRSTPIAHILASETQEYTLRLVTDK